MITYKHHPEKKETLLKVLHPFVKKWFFSRFQEFSLPQRFGVLPIHSRQNILVSAPTGATKTLTAFLAILNELVDSAEKGILEDKIYAVYVSPLKALNEDIKVNLLTPLQEIEEITGKKLGIRIGVRTGDTSQKEKSAMLRKPPHILITTPESLAIILSSKKFIDHLHDVQWTIIDEIHSLAENKRGVHLSLSLERLQLLSPGMTRVGLSATVAPLEEVAKYLVGYENQEHQQQSKQTAFAPDHPQAIASNYALRPCIIVDVQFLKQTDLQVLSPVEDLIGTPHDIMHHKMYELLHQLIQKHRTTLIFTNTRAATERVVDTLKTKYPKHYTSENIGAHHGSLAKEFRHSIEQRLREGKLKVVASSTSLELGIDIGAIDLVILLGSPKSVARALQRVGRSGHALHAVTKGRIVVLDRDDLVECSLLLKHALEKKIDKIHIPMNALDVLVQHIYGMSINEPWHADTLFNVLRQSYCYHTLSYEDYWQILHYLNGDYVSLEERNIYRKIMIDETTNILKARGKLSRMLYMTNLGTIPDEAGVKVKVGKEVIGIIDEIFLERLKKGDVFVLGGETYEFLYSRGTTAQVRATSGRPPTVPSWFSEMLPLSFDLALGISKFRRLMEEKLTKESKEAIISWLLKYLYVDEKAAHALYHYFKEQYDYAFIPSDKKIVIEYLHDEQGHKAVFHTLFGRRVNDALSRAIGYIINKTEHLNVEVGINDNGFVLATNKKINGKKALQMLRSDKLFMILTMALENSEALKRRFRHCATRSFMILRNYMGRTKKVGRQAMSAQILMNAVKQIDPNFVILKEARREVLEDVMDIHNAEKVISWVEEGKTTIKEIHLPLPSPFAFNLVLQGFLDVLKIDDKIEFLRRMHEQVIASIALKQGKTGKDLQALKDEFSAYRYYEQQKKAAHIPLAKGQEMLIHQVKALPMPDRAKLELLVLIKENKPLSNYFIKQYEKYKDEIEKTWPKKLKSFVEKKIQSNFNYHAYWEQEALEETLAEEEALDKALIDLHKALRNRKERNIPETIKHDLFALVQAEHPEKISLHEETQAWLETFFRNAIPFHWSDHVVKRLQTQWEAWKKGK